MEFKVFLEDLQNRGFDISAIKVSDKYYNIITRGDKKVDLELYDYAIEDYSQAISFLPSHEWAYWRRGDVYRIKGMYHKAIEDLEIAISCNNAPKKIKSTKSWSTFDFPLKNNFG